MIPSDFITTMVRFTEDNPHVCIASPKLVYMDAMFQYVGQQTLMHLSLGDMELDFINNIKDNLIKSIRLS